MTFSLNLQTIPDSNINKSKIVKWETRFWKNTTSKGDYYADIDTTFALYRPFSKTFVNNFYTAIRTKNPYIADHGGWLVDSFNLSDEQIYYYSTANESNTWKPTEENLLEKYN